MKKWQGFLLSFLLFFTVDISLDFVKSLIENGTLNKWIFAVFGLLIIGAGITGLLLVTKRLKQAKKHDDRVLVWFIYLILIWTAFDVMKYSLENKMLNHWYFLIIAFIFMSLGYIGRQIDTISQNPRNRSK